MIKTPTWFTDALSDTVTPPSKITIPTYNRMVAAGDKNVQMSIFDKVVDMSDLYN